MDKELILSIVRGERDSEIEEIMRACKDRRDQLNSIKIYEFQEGDKVRYNGQTNPKYLRGVVGTIRKVNRTKVVVDLDKPVGRFSRGITTPTSMIDKVDA